MKGEVISLHIGQAGVEIGNACWELYCLEHDITPDGRCETRLGCLGSFFEETATGKLVPRAILADLESSVVDQIRQSKYKNFYKPECLLRGGEDAANNYARGRYTVGKHEAKKTLKALRIQAEAAEQLQGFLTFHSYGGGTGSGFATLISEHLTGMFSKKCFHEVAIFPSQKMSTSVVEPYNTVLATSATLSSTDCVFLADNEAMYNICSSRLKVDRPMYSHLNQLLAQAVSFLTLSLRFGGDLNADFMDFQTNLIPFPRIHFPLMSMAPIVDSRGAGHETYCTSNITSQCFDSESRLARCKLESGLYIACCLLYRGDVAPKDVNASIRQLKGRVGLNFVSWSPTGFKVGINCQPAISGNANLAMIAGPRSVSCFSNSTAVGTMWENLLQKFNAMSDHKAFFHWFLSEGIEEGEFSEAENNLACLVMDYETMDT